MALFSLIPHPDHPHPDLEITVGLTARPDAVGLSYRLSGAVEKILLAEPGEPARADHLWQHSCFELFLKPVGQDGYVEFNFSPSGRWAAYAFDGRRTGMRDLVVAVAPHIETVDNGVTVDCDLSGLADGAMAMALTAVIEATDGTRSYWALAHAPGPPDFHNPAGFIATLPAA